MNIWDLVVILFYMASMFVVGMIFKRRSKDGSDYFRGGGDMKWWMVGVSACVSGFSAWTFTGMASEYYRSGFLLIIVSMVVIVVTGPMLMYFAPRFRQMRAITFCDVVLKRYGTSAEQLYVWISVVVFLLATAVALYSGSLFISAVFDLPLNWTIAISGLVVVALSVAGGSWAVVSSDFVQLFTIIGICLYLAIRGLMLPEIGGLMGYIDKIPYHHLHFEGYMRWPIVLFFILYNLVVNILYVTNVADRGARSLYVKDGKEARKAAGFMVLLNFIVGFIFMTPVVICAILYPDLATAFPQLASLGSPEEGAYVAIALRLLPQGLLGLLVCAIFAANMSTMDSGLNRTSGILVQNFYLRFMDKNPKAGDGLTAGRWVTLGLGCIIIGLAIGFDSLRSINLFDFYQLLWGVINGALAVPMIAAIVVKRTPPWSCWTTVLVGGIAAVLVRLYLDPVAVGTWLGWGENFNQIEKNRINIGVVNLIPISVSIAWFLFTRLFWEKSSDEHKERVEKLFEDVRTPVVAEEKGGEDMDAYQYSIMGKLCLFYGVAIMLGFLFPNPWSGRAGFLFCGGLITACGLTLFWAGARHGRRVNAEKEAAGSDG